MIIKHNAKKLSRDQIRAIAGLAQRKARQSYRSALQWLYGLSQAATITVKQASAVARCERRKYKAALLGIARWAYRAKEKEEC
jgi:hypothetical protein